VREAPQRRLDETNLRPLCKHHHDAHTARQVGFAGRGARDGTPPKKVQVCCSETVRPVNFAWSRFWNAKLEQGGRPNKGQRPRIQIHKVSGGEPQGRGQRGAVTTDSGPSRRVRR
jgi:hypothetical protein